MLFNFDYHNSFLELGVDVSASFPTASSQSTYIYGNTSRVKGDDFESFSYVDDEFTFGNKTKTILADGEMVLVENPNGSVYLIDYIDSCRNGPGEDYFDGVELQYRFVKEPEPIPTYTIVVNNGVEEIKETNPNSSYVFVYENGWQFGQDPACSEIYYRTEGSVNEDDFTTDISGII